MQVSLSGADFQKIMNEAIAQTATTEAGKTATAAVSGNNLTISYTDASGNQVVMEPIDLDEANDGGILADPVAIKDLIDKIGKSFSAKDIQLDQKLLDDFEKCLLNEIDKAKSGGSSSYSSIHDTYLVLFEIIALLQRTHQTMKKSVFAARMSALQSEIQAITNQAAAEREAAFTGLFTSMAVGCLQATVSGVMKYKEIKSELGANKALTNQAAVDQKLLDHAKLLGAPESATAEMNKCAKDLNIDTMNKIAAEIGGYSVGVDKKTVTHTAATPDSLKQTFGEDGVKKIDTGVMDAKADLEKAIEQRDNPEKHITEKSVVVTEGDAAGTKVKNYTFEGGKEGGYATLEEAKTELSKKAAAEVEEKKSNLVKLVDGKVDQIKSARDQAANKLDVAKKNLAEAEAGGAGKKEIAGLKQEVENCQNDLNTLNKDLIYADAVRTNLFANGVGPKNEPLLSGKECGFRQDMASNAYDRTLQRGMMSSEFKEAKHNAKTWELIATATSPLMTMLNQLPQSITGIMNADAQKYAVEKLKAEEQYTAFNELYGQLTKSQDMTIDMLTKVFESFLATQRTAIRA